MGFAYFSRWRFVVFFVKYASPHPTSVVEWICFPFSSYKRGFSLFSNSHFSSTYDYLYYYPIVLGIYFLPKFIRKLICGLKFVISFSSVRVVR